MLLNHLFQIQSSSYKRYVALTGSAHCDIANPVIVFCYSSIIEKSYGHLKYLNHYVSLTGILHCHIVNIMNALTTPNSVVMYLLPGQ